MNSPRVILAGGSGFLGRALARALLVRGYQPIILTRSPRECSGFKEVFWDGAHVGDWIQHLNGAAAIVNLAGRSVNCPHTPENIGEILESRVNSVNAIAKALAHVKSPPLVWVQAGATGFYGDTRDRLCDESSPPGDDALAGVCKLWEAAFHSAATPGTRRVLLRIGFVLGRDGGALPVLSRLTRWFLGGTAGNGRQFISWIHLEDLLRMFIAALARTDLTGTFNAVAPHPVCNAGFMVALRRALHRPWSPPVPALAVRVGARVMQTEPSLVLNSQCCAPIRFLEAGFEYQFPQLPAALENLCRTG